MPGDHWDDRWTLKGAPRSTTNRLRFQPRSVSRRNVVNEIKPARVFEAFCGPETMRRQAWHDVRTWVGCDLAEWNYQRDTPRFVADNLRVMRAIDLHAFNVFDLDAYGSPWAQMLILSARRKWGAGERGAVVLTDGSSLKTRMGGVPHAMAQMCGLSQATGLAATASSGGALFDLCLSSWLRASGVKAERRWDALGKGLSAMRYCAVVFSGIDRQEP